MVREANESRVFVEKFKEQVRLHRKPPFSVSKFCSSVMVGYLWAQVFMIAIPDFEFMDINWKFLHWVVPFVVSLGNILHFRCVTIANLIFKPVFRCMERWKLWP